MSIPKLSLFIWQITAVCLFCVEIVHHTSITTLTERLGEIEELARMQNGWVFIDLKDE